jgi:hypothetical protein
MKQALLSLFLFFFIYSYSQNYETGQLLVEFKEDANIRSFIQKYSKLDTKSTELKISEKLIPNMNYYLLEFDKNISTIRIKCYKHLKGRVL